MTKEEKDLLIKDLCGRLPYGVKINNEIQGDFKIYGICENFVFGRNEICHIDFNIDKIKPYLYPLSSMTEEQRNEYHELLYNPKHSIDIDYFDWCHKNHLDCRGLIPMGRAIDATKLNIYKV